VNRRNFLTTISALAATVAFRSSFASRTPLAMDAATFHSKRKFASTESGSIAYVEQGEGPVALFVHGVPLNGFHWRHVMAAMKDSRRCIAIDLMGLGYTRIGPEQDVSFVAQAKMVRQFLDALGIEQLDLVANDSGGAISQIFAVHNSSMLRTLTLTNCDVQDNWPPKDVLPAIEAARQGTLIDRYVKLINDPEERYRRLARAYADPKILTDEVYRTYIDPLARDAQTRNNFHRYWTSFDNSQTRNIEPQLRTLKVPTQVIWALDDIFFDVEWAYWLKKTIPGVRRVIEVPGAKLFFPEDRPQALIEPLRSFWARDGAYGDSMAPD
jgi:pimeloyl-ACP methyl ester carboxylesterase